MMRKTFKSTISGFKLNEVADKENISLYFIIKIQKGKRQKVTNEENPSTKNRHEKLQYIYKPENFTCQKLSKNAFFAQLIQRALSPH